MRVIQQFRRQFRSKAEKKCILLKKVVYICQFLWYNDHVRKHHIIMQNNYPTHEEIAAQILTLVNGNLNCPCAHNRENLNDIIQDLQRYRESIPTVSDYVEKNLL